MVVVKVVNDDGPFVQNIEYILAFQYATELKQLGGNARIAVCMIHGRTLRGEAVHFGMLNISTINELICSDKAYKCLKQVRGTPAY